MLVLLCFQQTLAIGEEMLVWEVYIILGVQLCDSSAIFFQLPIAVRMVYRLL